MPSPEEDPRILIGGAAIPRPSLDSISQRIRLIERVLSRIPLVGLDYENELRAAGLKRLDFLGK